MINPWIDVILRSAAMLAAGILFDALFRARAAALRHFVLAMSVCAALAVIPLSFVVPALNVPIDPRSDVGSVLVSTRSVVEADPAPPAPRVNESRGADRTESSPVPLAALVWFTGFAIAFCSLLAAVYRLAATVHWGRTVADPEWIAMARQIAAAFGIRRSIRIIETDAPDLLATWGLWRPAVLLPFHAREWSRDRMHAVLCHELAHIRRNDWMVQMLAEVLRTLLWFNPLIWIACTRLRRAGEQACDDAVLGRGVAADDYAAHLLDLARRCRRSGRWVSATPMAHPSTLERRIVAMLNPRLDRQALTRRAAALAAVLLLAVAVPVTALRATQAPPSFFSGAVYDPTGAVIPGVTLTLEDASGGKQTAQTDSAGRFQVASVAPGKYVLSASLPGFRPLRQEFELRDARDWDKAITLQLGTLQESISVRSTRMTAPATATRPQGPAPIRVGGNIRVPRKVEDVKPVFPDSMRAAGREGVVTLDAIIGEDGSVRSVRVVSGDVHPDFAIAAADAVRQWRFTPTLLNGQPVEVVMTVKIDFRLSN